MLSLLGISPSSGDSAQEPPTAALASADVAASASASESASAAASAPEPEARSFLICGIVQGVGFRPFVYNLAQEHGLQGWVLNATDGVHIHAQGSGAQLRRFTQELQSRAPKMSRIESLDCSPAAPDPSCTDFQIRLSDGSTQAGTLVSPDIATCEDCLRELKDPQNRRYRYPFINCTQCGPRFTIIRALPYDRPATSMAGFTMCPPCEHEYHEPANRRFHAQPDACFDCGPVLSYWRAGDSAVQYGSTRQLSDALIAKSVEDLRAGGILGIKGLGGFHLACDARNPQAVALLRQRKRRPAKPFAVMMRGMSELREYCIVSPEEEALLTGSIRPIVLLELRPDGARLAPGIADGLHELGVMLPYTPLQQLLLEDFGGPLVMTSGNLSEEPILASDDEARRHLGAIADSFLSNNRPILSRYDDSVLRVVDKRVLPLRRARGLAPSPIPLPPSLNCDDAARAQGLHSAPRVLACGPEQKSTFCLSRGGKAFVSQHIGDLENQLSFESWQQNLELYQRLFQIKPTLLAADMHPEYLSSKWAQQQSQTSGLPLVQVQHHHAHIAAVSAEHNIPSPVIGLALDGTGYGDDGRIWGAELLICDWQNSQRLAHLEYLPLPGGAAAIKNPCRTAWAMLRHYGLQEHPGAAQLAASLSDSERSVVNSLVDKNFNCPYSSSAGRLMDAVSALLGICHRASYDGEAAIMLEAALPALPALPAAAAPDAALPALPAAAAPAAEPRYPFLQDEQGVISFKEGLIRMLDDIAAAKSRSQIASDFMESFSQAWARAAVAASAASGIVDVCLGGGVFMNRHLLASLRPRLAAAGLRVYIGKELPANDGCISYGQAVVALARWKAAQGHADTTGESR